MRLPLRERCANRVSMSRTGRSAAPIRTAVSRCGNRLCGHRRVAETAMLQRTHEHQRHSVNAPSTVRKLPQAAALVTTAPESMLIDPTAQAVADSATAASSKSAEPAPVRPPAPAIVRPLTPERYKVQFTIGPETHQKLRRVQLERDTSEGPCHCTGLVSRRACGRFGGLFHRCASTQTSLPCGNRNPAINATLIA